MQVKFYPYEKERWEGGNIYSLATLKGGGGGTISYVVVLALALGALAILVLEVGAKCGRVTKSLAIFPFSSSPPRT